MNKYFCALLIFLFSENVFAQHDDTLLYKSDTFIISDTPKNKTDTANTKTTAEKTGLSFSSYFILLGDNFFQQVTAPFHQTGKDWLHTGIYAVSVASLSAIADEPVQRFAIKIHDSSKTVTWISGNVTQFGGRYELYTLAALGSYGFIFNNKKLQTTTLLATQAYITSGLIESAVKYITGRQRPSYYDPNHPESEPYFHGPAFSGGKNAYGEKINTSFPSGHTTVAFAVATVFAKEYNNISWVPPLAYSAASLVGVSRIMENKHWVTDVVVGSTLGFLCGRQVVNNYHRYLNPKAQQNKGEIAFNINYNGYNLEPGFVYTFRK